MGSSDFTQQKFLAELRPIARFDTLLPDYSCQTRTTKLLCQIVGCGTFFLLGAGRQDTTNRDTAI